MSSADDGAGSAHSGRTGQTPELRDPKQHPGSLPDWQTKAQRIAFWEVGPFYYWLLREGTRAELATHISDHALARAIKTFDPSRGKFEPWLRQKIEREIQRVRQQCRNDHWTEATDDLSYAVDSAADPIGAWEHRVDGATAVRRALEALPSEDRPFLRAFVEAFSTDAHRFIAKTAELLGVSRGEAQRAWDRIVYRLARAFPDGFTEFGL
jgi:DNA-directed RNA polymerase specialized sigma24 family protein